MTEKVKMKYYYGWVLKVRLVDIFKMYKLRKEMVLCQRVVAMSEGKLNKTVNKDSDWPLNAKGIQSGLTKTTKEAMDKRMLENMILMTYYYDLKKGGK